MLLLFDPFLFLFTYSFLTSYSFLVYPESSCSHCTRLRHAVLSLQLGRRRPQQCSFSVELLSLWSRWSVLEFESEWNLWMVKVEMFQYFSWHWAFKICNCVNYVGLEEMAKHIQHHKFRDVRSSLIRWGVAHGPWRRPCEAQMMDIDEHQHSVSQSFSFPLSSPASSFSSQLLCISS